MSRRSQQQGNQAPVRPTSKFFEFNGKHGEFHYWDKEAKEKVTVDFPINFLSVVDRATVSGFCNEQNANIRCNEIKNSKQETFKVDTWAEKPSIIGNGYWEDIKVAVGAKGGKFTTVIYACYLNTKTRSTELVGILLKSSQIRAYSEFKKSLAAKGVDILNVIITIKGVEKKSNGAVTYYVPQFGYVENYDYNGAKWKNLEGVAEDFCNQIETYEEQRDNYEQQPEVQSADVDAQQPQTSQPQAEPVAVDAADDDDDLAFLGNGSDDELF